MKFELGNNAHVYAVFVSLYHERKAHIFSASSGWNVWTLKIMFGPVE